jgi:hypothetical protein
MSQRIGRQYGPQLTPRVAKLCVQNSADVLCVNSDSLGAAFQTAMIHDPDFTICRMPEDTVPCGSH